MSQSLDLVQLRSLVTIADSGGFGRAATALHLSQSTVSQHVRLLEKRLGQTLVERDGRRARFTAAGERLLLEARRILAVHDDALERLDVARSDTIVIGSTETAADELLPKLLGTLSLAYPGRTVQFHLDRSTQMTAAIARGTIDLAVLLGFPGDTVGRQIGSLELGWFSGTSWVEPDPSASWPLVAYVEPCGMRQRALAALSDADRRVVVTAESTSLEGVMAAVRAGLGLAVLPTAGRVPDGLVRRSDLPPLGRIGVNLAVRRGLDPGLEAVASAALADFFDRPDSTAPVVAAAIG